MRHWLVCLNLMASFTACQTTRNSTWDGKVYLGDSQRLGVARTPFLPVISCSAPEFDTMICMPAPDYESMLQQMVRP